MRFQRELTAGVLIPGVLAVVVAAPTWAFALLVVAAAGLALLEFFAMLTEAGLTVPKAAGLLLFAALVGAAHLARLDALVWAAGAALLVLPTLVLFSSSSVPALLPSAAASAFATLYVGAGGAAFVGLRSRGWKPVLFLLAVVWAGDSAAYYVGRRWGKRKLAPVVSPKKTWEGFWGQMAGGTAAGAAAAALSTEPSQLLVGAGLGAGLSAVAVVGDLVESTFKRSCDVKDSGALLPGHGGLLDRLDSLLFSAPFLYGALLLLPGTLLR